MSREIKFRAWNEELEEMYELRKANYLGSTGIIDPYIGGEKSIWQQCTGLKDKNGVDIYEGDVISDNISMFGIVEFKNSAYRVNYKNNSCKWFIDYIESEIKTIEVIGNIYENKNLLEEK